MPLWDRHGSLRKFQRLGFPVRPSAFPGRANTLRRLRPKGQRKVAPVGRVRTARTEPPCSAEQIALPTEARERHKELETRRKAQGIDVAPKKRKFIIENHSDDCGDDLTGLGIPDECLFQEWDGPSMTSDSETDSDCSSTDSTNNEHGPCQAIWSLFGSDTGE